VPIRVAVTSSIEVMVPLKPAAGVTSGGSAGRTAEAPAGDSIGSGAGSLLGGLGAVDGGIAADPGLLLVGPAALGVAVLLLTVALPVCSAGVLPGPEQAVRATATAKHSPIS
jgi:hypothetical protein